jgi:hypothetical protein
MLAIALLDRTVNHQSLIGYHQGSNLDNLRALWHSASDPYCAEHSSKRELYKTPKAREDFFAGWMNAWQQGPHYTGKARQ